MNTKELLKSHASSIEKTLSGRYIHPQNVEELLGQLPDLFSVKIVGFSVEKRPIQTVTFGHGKTKVLMWSQMHGNESTTTRSLFDFFNFIGSKNHENYTKNLLEKCTFCIIPMLNPDGSKQWIRENANGIDLNRDAIHLSQPESKILRASFDTFKPDYCLNLHGQRTIYGFEDTGKPSVLSFLAPSANDSRTFTLSRKRSASLIVHIFKSLEKQLPGQIGLYDDGFNANCVGDMFQSLGVPTVLFEAGHHPDDYGRDKTRAYIFVALLAAIEGMIENVSYDVGDYQKIPQHSKCFCDIHNISDDGLEKVQLIEVVENEKIVFKEGMFSKALGTGSFAHLTVKK